MGSQIILVLISGTCQCIHLLSMFNYTTLLITVRTAALVHRAGTSRTQRNISLELHLYGSSGWYSCMGGRTLHLV